MKRKTAFDLLLWVALPIAALGLAFLLRSGILAVCVYAFFFLLVLARLMVAFWLRPLECVREISDDVVPVGGTVKVFVKLTNRSSWPILWNYIEETVPKQMLVVGTTKRLIFLPPGRSFHLHYAVTIPRRGCHQIGPVVMETGDVFGLFKKCRIDPRKDFITAVPPYQLIEEFQVGRRRRLGDIAAERSVFEDPTRLRGVREYRRGDALKRIHWRSSAHTGELVSKIYDPVIEPGATVVLDFHQDAWKNAHSRSADKTPPEMAVTAACTISRYLCDGGWKVGFFSNGRDPLGLPGLTVSQVRETDTLREAAAAARARREDNRLAPISIRASAKADQFLIIHENLGRIELSDGLPIGPLLMEELPYIEREQALVLITGEADESFITHTLRARELGYRMMVFLICNTVSFDRAFEALAPHGIEVFDINEEWRLEEIATGRKSF